MTNPLENHSATSDHVMGALIGAGLEVEGIQDKLAADPAAIDALNFVQVTLGDALDFIDRSPRKADDMTETYPEDLDDLDDLIGETYIALGEAEDALGALATRVELYHSHPTAPATIELERHLTAARAALAALEDALPADGVHKPYPAAPAPAAEGGTYETDSKPCPDCGADSSPTGTAPTYQCGAGGCRRIFTAQPVDWSAKLWGAFVRGQAERPGLRL